MKKIKLDKIIIDNFRGIKKAEINFINGYQEIIGGSGQGKTSIVTAFLFAIGTDFKNIINYKDEDLEACVKIILNVDGNKIGLTRKAKVHRSKKERRGVDCSACEIEENGKKKFLGIINYKFKLANLFGIENFKDLQKLTVLEYFDEDLNWRKRRDWLYRECNIETACQSISEEDRFSSVLENISTLDESNRHIASCREDNRKLDDENLRKEAVLNDIKTRVENYVNIDFDKIKTQIKEIDTEIVKENNIYEKAQQEQSSNINNLLSEKSILIEKDLNKQRHIERNNYEYEKEGIKIKETRDILKWHQDVLKKAEDDEFDKNYYQGVIDRMQNDIEKAENDSFVSNLTNIFSAKKFEIDRKKQDLKNLKVVEICGFCNQKIPHDQIEEQKEKMGKEMKENINNLQKEYDEFKLMERKNIQDFETKKANNIKELKQNLIEEEQNLSKRKQEFNKQKATKIDAVLLTIKNFKTELEQSETKFKTLKLINFGSNKRIEEIRVEVNVLNKIVLNKVDMTEQEFTRDNLMKELKLKELLDIDEKRMDTLKKELKDIKIEYQKKEKTISLISEWQAEVAKKAESIINLKFKDVEWKLFKRQENGDFIETCYCLYKNRPRVEDFLSKGEKLQCDSSVLQSIQEITNNGIQLPIFVDNASIADKIQLNTDNAQIIALVNKPGKTIAGIELFQ